MKLIIFVNGLLTLSLGAVASISYEQASRLVPRLAPRVADNKASTKPLVPSYDNDQKNFTHDELFALQKRFLDNFVAPNNTLQVRCTASELKITSTDQL